MKTGTPVRIDRRSVHFEDMEIQEGEMDFHQFSFMGNHRVLKQLPCWTCYTNKEAHAELLKGLPDSPLYNGQIQSIGPRYCPSVETKLMTFPDKKDLCAKFTHKSLTVAFSDIFIGLSVF